VKNVDIPSSSVNIAEVKPGMVLAADAVNPRGALLIRAGQSLNEKNIRMLKSWGVSNVLVIRDEEEEETGEEDIAAPDDQTIEEEVRKRFAKCIDHPVMAEVMDVAIELKLKSAREKRA
jgi:hypothetical protein